MTCPAVLKKTVYGFPVWVVAAAFLPRLFLLLLCAGNDAYLVTQDSAGYLALADNLLANASFSLRGASGALIPETFRTPGYPVFLSLVSLLPGSLPVVAAVIQTLISGATVLLAWKWFEKLSGPAGAAPALLFFSLDYISIMHAPVVLAEPLFMLFLIFASTRTWTVLEEPRPRRAFSAGLLWGCVALIKPVSLYFPLLAAMMFRGTKKTVFLFLLASFSLPAAWSARNYLQTGHFGFSSIGGVVLLKYAAGSVESLRTGKGFSETAEALLAEAEGDAPSGGFLNDADRAAVYSDKALGILKSHPFLVMRYLLRGLAVTVAGTGMEMIPQALGLRYDFPSNGKVGGGTAALLGAYPLLWLPQTAYIFFMGGVYVLFAMGLFALWRSGRRPLAVFLAVSVVYFFGMAATNGYYRYRIPPMFFMSAGISAVFRPRRL